MIPMNPNLLPLEVNFCIEGIEFRCCLTKTKTDTGFSYSYRVIEDLHFLPGKVYSVHCFSIEYGVDESKRVYLRAVIDGRTPCDKDFVIKPTCKLHDILADEGYFHRKQIMI